MANPVTTGSIKGYKCTQWKEGKKWKRKNGNKGYRKTERKKENRVNEERNKEYKQPKVMGKYK